MKLLTFSWRFVYKLWSYFGFLRRIVCCCVCYNISEERTASIFRVTGRVQVDAEITGGRKIYMFPINCHVFPPSLQHPPEQIQPENWGSMFLRNPSNYIPIYTAPCLRRLESSTLLRAPQTSYRQAILFAHGQWLNFVCVYCGLSPVGAATIASQPLPERRLCQLQVSYNSKIQYWLRVPQR